MPRNRANAPATFVSATSISFQDADGDAVVVTLNKPVLTPATIDTVFQFHTGPITGNGTPQQLQTIDLTGFTNGLSVTAKATAANGGDGKVNVGYIKGDGRDLGNVVIGGDLGRVTAGDPNTKSPRSRCCRPTRLRIRNDDAIVRRHTRLID